MVRAFDTIPVGVIMLVAAAGLIIMSLIITSYLLHSINVQAIEVAISAKSSTEGVAKEITSLEFFSRALAMLSIGIAFGMAALAAGAGIAIAGTAALSAATERPEISTLGMIITAFAETVAIYGLVVVIIMLGKI